jgi:hypothetical protein
MTAAWVVLSLHVVLSAISPAAHTVKKQDTDAVLKLTLLRQASGGSAAGWNMLTSGSVYLYHNLDDLDQPRHVLALVARARREIADELGTQPTEPLTVFLCRDASSFAQAAGAPPTKAQVGVALLLKHQIVLLAFRRGRPVTLAESAVHEVAHLVLVEAGGRELPLWFQEGFALYQSHQVSFAEAFRLSLAAVFGGLVPLEQIEERFPYGSRLSHLAYAQSLDAFSYLSGRVGLKGVGNILHGTKRHGSFSLALRNVYGEGPVMFEDDWRDSLKKRYRWPLLLAGWVPVVGMLLAATLVVGCAKWIATKRKLAQWRKEEQGRAGADEPGPL